MNGHRAELSPTARRKVIHVIQGQYGVTRDPGVVISTLLGSCVAACIRDPEIGVGGMNHFLLPEGQPGSSSLSYGVNAMELLINDLLKRGARRDRLEAKLFGGARLFRGLTDVGAQNAAFGRRFLEDEGIRHLGGSLGGVHARRVEFSPDTGRVRQQLIERDEEVFEAESVRSDESKDSGGLEFL